MRDRNEIKYLTKSPTVSRHAFDDFWHSWYSLFIWVIGCTVYLIFFFSLRRFIAYLLIRTEIVAIGCILIIIDIIHTIMVTYRLFVGHCRDGNGLLIVYPGQMNRRG